MDIRILIAHLISLENPIDSIKSSKSVLIIILLTLSSKVFGYKGSVVAAKFGSIIETDIFL